MAAKRRRRVRPEIPQGIIDEIMYRMGEYGRGSTLWVNFDLRSAKIAKDRLRRNYYVVQVPSFSGKGSISFGFEAKFRKVKREKKKKTK